MPKSAEADGAREEPRLVATDSMAVADLAANCNNEHRVRPTAAGDYTITVTECKKADRWRGRFRLRVGVR